MSDDERFNPVSERLRIAQDLSAIEDMFARLRTEIQHHAADPEIPGGAAMVLLGPGADIEAFGWREMSELMGRTQGTTEPTEPGEVEPPLSFLASWVDIVREHRAQEPSRQRATIAREIRYLREALDWMLITDDTGRPWFIQVIDFADGLHRVRRFMERTLRDGDQVDEGAPCLNVACDGRPLIKDWSDIEDSDMWHCTGCGRWYDRDDYARASAMASKAYADRLAASDMLEVYRIEPSTLRSWVRRGKVRRRGRDSAGRLLYDVAQALAMRDTPGS